MEKRLVDSIRKSARPATQKTLQNSRDYLADATKIPRRLGTSEKGVFVIDFSNEEKSREKPQQFTIWCDQPSRVEYTQPGDHTQRQLYRERTHPHVPLNFDYRDIAAVYITPHEYPANLEYHPIAYSGEDGFIFSQIGGNVSIERGTAENVSMSFLMSESETLDFMFNPFNEDGRTTTTFTGATPPYSIPPGTTEISIPRQPSHWRLEFVERVGAPGTPETIFYSINSTNPFDQAGLDEGTWVEDNKNTVTRFRLTTPSTVGSYSLRLELW